MAEKKFDRSGIDKEPPEVTFEELAQRDYPTVSDLGCALFEPPNHYGRKVIPDIQTPNELDELLDIMPKPFTFYLGIDDDKIGYFPTIVPVVETIPANKSILGPQCQVRNRLTVDAHLLHSKTRDHAAEIFKSSLENWQYYVEVSKLVNEILNTLAQFRDKFTDEELNQYIKRLPSVNHSATNGGKDMRLAINTPKYTENPTEKLFQLLEEIKSQL